MTSADLALKEKRTQYLRGIAASAPSVAVGSQALHSIFQAAFKQVQNREDWKGPINALVSICDADGIGLDLYINAIRYFTGTEPEVFLLNDNKSSGTQIVRIVSEGYRLGRAGAGIQPEIKGDRHGNV